MARLSRPIAEALRNSYRFDAARRHDENRAPGLLILDANNDVELLTPTTSALLAPVLRDDRIERNVPVPVLALAAEVRRRGSEGRIVRPLHIPTSEGWLSCTARCPTRRSPDGSR